VWGARKGGGDQKVCVGAGVGVGVGLWWAEGGVGGEGSCSWRWRRVVEGEGAGAGVGVGSEWGSGVKAGDFSLIHGRYSGTLHSVRGKYVMGKC
jgi:hypothetical protein